jgi:hypothetical protein
MSRNPEERPKFTEIADFLDILSKQEKIEAKLKFAYQDSSSAKKIVRQKTARNDSSSEPSSSSEEEYSMSYKSTSE